jgi:hypothetical protein
MAKATKRVMMMAMRVRINNEGMVMATRVMGDQQ